MDQRQYQLHLGPQRQLLDQQRGQIVEQVHIIHAQHHNPTATIAHDSIRRPPQKLTRVSSSDLAQQGRERSQGQAPRRGRRANPSGCRPGPGRAAKHFASQPGLTHTGAAGEHNTHPSVSASPEPLPNQPQLLRTPHQRPFVRHAPILTSSGTPPAGSRKQTLAERR